MCIRDRARPRVRGLAVQVASGHPLTHRGRVPEDRWGPRFLPGAIRRHDGDHGVGQPLRPLLQGQLPHSWWALPALRRLGHA
eukprot:3864750-Alexandrium_andersonii.AAC.1